MSHFVVAVVTPTLDALEATLQPYHEFECTGEDDQYVQDVDLTDEIKELIGAPIGYGENKDKPRDLTDALGYHGLDDRIVSSESELDKGKTHKYGYAVVVDGQLVKAVRRTNPNKKWDWWTIGGRWKNLLSTKNGENVNQSKKADLDILGMRAQAETEAAERYDAAIKVIDVRPIPHWENFREVLFPGDIDAARAAYRADPVIKDWAKAYPDNFFGPSPEDYDMPREAYIEAAGDNSFGAFAVLDANGWHEKGSMGWFGCVTDEKDPASWGKQLQAFLAAIPEDHYISMVDCHI